MMRKLLQLGCMVLALATVLRPAALRQPCAIGGAVRRAVDILTLRPAAAASHGAGEKAP